MNKLREDFYKAAFSRYEGRFASGEIANNKLEVDKLQRMPSLRAQVSEALVLVAKKFNPDMVMAVPRGGNWVAIDLAWNLGAAILLLDKNEETGDFHFQSGGEDALRTSRRLLIVDDMFTKFTNTRKAMELPGVRERAVGAVAIDDRGDSSKRVDVNLPHDALFQEYIPPVLPANSRFWKYAE
jgi:orotate phosphoribosyltransferase